MEPTNQPRFFRSRLFLTGLSLLLLAAMMVLGLVITTAREQALTPGERSLGVAALAILWMMPLLLFAASGVVISITSVSMFLYRKYNQRKASLPE